MHSESGNDPVATSRPSFLHDDGSWLPMALYCPACGRWVADREEGEHRAVELPARMWLYTNYDCNLHCSYCLVQSSPWADRRGIGLETFQKVVEEGVELGIRELFLTGGEPFILPEIYPMMAFAAQRVPTTVLTNAMIIRGPRLERLKEVASPNLSLQVSLDDDEPEAHDYYRGEGSWKRAMAGINLLLGHGFRVKIATTVTPQNAQRVDRIRRFVREDLGIAEEDHIVRPLLQRGFSEEGLEVTREDLVPEITVDAEGVYWHPVGNHEDLRVSSQVLPLRASMEEIARLSLAGSATGRQPFR